MTTATDTTNNMIPRIATDTTNAQMKIWQTV